MTFGTRGPNVSIYNVCHWIIVKYIPIHVHNDCCCKKVQITEMMKSFFQYEEDYMYKLVELRAWQMHLFIQWKFPALDEKNVSTAWDTK